MGRVAVQMLCDRGSNFRGEKVFFDESRAHELVAQRVCLLLDEAGNPILPTTGVVEEGNAGNDNANEGGNGKPEGKAKPSADKPKGKASKGKAADNQPNPFEIDGFDPKIVAALSDAGITNPAELRAYVASGKTLAALPVIGVVTEKELLDLYGEEPE